MNPPELGRCPPKSKRPSRITRSVSPRHRHPAEDRPSVRRHAEASLILEARDSGKGIPPEKIDARGSYGLSG